MLKNTTNEKTVKKPNVNVNAYMKKSKRNNENINEDAIPDTISECVILVPDVIPSAKALNLIKARDARKNNIKNKNTSREERIINLINEIKEEEMIKLNNKTEKLKIKLMKLI